MGRGVEGPHRRGGEPPRSPDRGGEPPQHRPHNAPQAAGHAPARRAPPATHPGVVLLNDEDLGARSRGRDTIVLPKMGGETTHLFCKVSRPPGAAKTPKISDLRSVKNHVLKTQV